MSRDVTGVSDRDVTLLSL